MKIADLQQLLDDWNRAKTSALMRQLAGWLDTYVHTLPPNERAHTVNTMLRLWTDHQTKWQQRTAGIEATDTEHNLTTSDWRALEIVMMQLLVDINGKRDTHQ